MIKFLGRECFDCKTMTYSFRDGSGVVPDEMRQDLLLALEDRNALGANGISYLWTLFSWKDRLAKRETSLDNGRDTA